MTSCELVSKYALEYKDAEFFSKLAYQRAFISQVRYIQGAAPQQVIGVLRQALQDFITAFELGYRAEAIEINNWFYRSLVVNDPSLSHFLAAFPEEIWPYGDAFSRFQALWGFAQLRAEKEQSLKLLEILYGLCVKPEIDLAPNEKKPLIRRLQENAYQLMHAIYMNDSSSLTRCLHMRARLRPIIPAEGTRYELFQPIDLVGLGLCRLANLNGISLDLDEPTLPMALLRHN